MSPAGAALSPPEATDLERRVLAHERILQSLIAYMSRTEPRFVEHLRDRFVDPMTMAGHEHDFWDVDDYAAEFIRAIILIGEKSKPAVVGERKHSSPATGLAPLEQPANSCDRVQMKETNGIWHVTVDGAFWGDFREKEWALTAIALAQLSLR